MPSVPQLPRKSQIQQGQETAENISEMRGSFRAAAAEASNRVMKRSFSSLFSALKFRDKQESFSTETRKSFRNVTGVLGRVDQKVSYSTEILSEINRIQFRSLGLLRDIIFGISEKNSQSILGGMPKTLINLLKIAGLAGVMIAGGAVSSAAKTLLQGENAEESIADNIQEKEPLSQDALAPKDTETKQTKDEQDSAELSTLADDFEKYVTGEDKTTQSETKTAATEASVSTPAMVKSETVNTQSNFVPAATPVEKQNVTAVSPNIEQNAVNELRNKNQIDAGSKLTRSLVFSSDTITFSADEIEFIQKKIENVKSEEIEKLTENTPTDHDHSKPETMPSTDAMGNVTGTGGLTPGSGGPPGKNPGSGSETFGGPVKPELGEIKTKSGLTAQVSKDLVPKFQGFVTDLESTGYNIRDLGGFAMRANVNNPSKWSAHAYGAAIDINAATNPNQTRQTDMPVEKVQSLIQKHGLGWGLNWQSVGDPMHFSAMPNEGGTGLPSSTTPDQQGGGGTPGSPSDTSGGNTGAGATPVSKESVSPNSSPSPVSDSAPSQAPASAPQASPVPAAAPEPPPVSTGANINRMSQSSSPLKPRPTIDQLLNSMQLNENVQNNTVTNPPSSANPVTMDPSKAGNVEPPDGKERVTELFGDYYNFGNAGSLG